MSDGPQPTTTPEEIKGNASLVVKQLLCNPGAFFSGRLTENHSRAVFCNTILSRLVVTEADIANKREDEKKKEAIVVTEIDVTDDMANGGGNVHGGCLAFLVDCTTTLALIAYSLDVDNDFFAGVSQSLNVTYHSPAVAGDKLRIVNYSVAGGSRAKTARCEVWNATHHRLVASGLHIKMQPSGPKTKL